MLFVFVVDAIAAIIIETTTVNIKLLIIEKNRCHNSIPIFHTIDCIKNILMLLFTCSLPLLFVNQPINMFSRNISHKESYLLRLWLRTLNYFWSSRCHSKSFRNFSTNLTQKKITKILKSKKNQICHFFLLVVFYQNN